jgi:hypothetical protein
MARNTEWRKAAKAFIRGASNSRSLRKCRRHSAAAGVALLCLTTPLATRCGSPSPPPDSCDPFRAVLTGLICPSPTIAEPKGIPADTETALACEWHNFATTQYPLAALALLTSDGKQPANANPSAKDDGKIASKVLEQLSRGVDPDSFALRVYRVALGIPDDAGNRSSDYMQNFAILLAGANMLTRQANSTPGYQGQIDQSKLFACTDQLVGLLYKDGPASATPKNESGPEAVARIDRAFRQSNLFGIYSLIQAEWHDTDTSKDEQQQRQQQADDEIRMEILRAAFKLNSAKLAAQVHSRM